MAVCPRPSTYFSQLLYLHHDLFLCATAHSLSDSLWSDRKTGVPSEQRAMLYTAHRHAARAATLNHTGTVQTIKHHSNARDGRRMQLTRILRHPLIFVSSLYTVDGYGSLVRAVTEACNNAARLCEPGAECVVLQVDVIKAQAMPKRIS